MWRRSTGIVAGLFTTLLLAVFFVFFAQPTRPLPLEPYIYLVILLIVEFVAFLVSALLAGGGYRGAIVKGLIMALFTSILLDYFLLPKNYGSFDVTYLIVFALEMIGLVFGAVLTSNKGGVYW